MKTKTYVLTLPVRFPKGHPREWEETEFAGKALAASQIEMRPVFTPWKLHTIRANYGLWKHRIDEVNAGRAVLSVREWLGAPRRSKQKELFRLDRDSGIGVERMTLSKWRFIDGLIQQEVTDGRGSLTYVSRGDIASNDGLTLYDWEAWFGNPRYDRTQPMAIIHFTSFRYCK